MQENNAIAPTQEQIEAAVRSVAQAIPSSVMAKLTAHVDKLRADGNIVEFRLDPPNQRVFAVIIEKCKVDLSEFADDEGQLPTDENGKPLIDFAWADEQDEAA